MSEEYREQRKDDLPPDAERDALEKALEAYKQSNTVKEDKARMREDLAAEQFKSVMLDNKITRISAVDAPPRGKPGATAPPEGTDPQAQLAAIQDRNRAQMIQYGTGLLTTVVSTLWITYFGQDAPAEVYAAIPAVVILAGQIGATKFNNRKVDS